MGRTEMPGPLPCPFCAKAPVALEDSDGVTWVQCYTVGCVTYGDIRWKLRLDLWNTRAGEHLTNESRAELKRLAEIGEAFCRSINLPPTASNEEFQDALRITGPAIHEHRQRQRGLGWQTKYDTKNYMRFLQGSWDEDKSPPSAAAQQASSHIGEQMEKQRRAAEARQAAMAAKFAAQKTTQKHPDPFTGEETP